MVGVVALAETLEVTVSVKGCRGIEATVAIRACLDATARSLICADHSCDITQARDEWVVAGDAAQSQRFELRIARSMDLATGGAPISLAADANLEADLEFCIRVVANCTQEMAVRETKSNAQVAAANSPDACPRCSLLICDLRAPAP